jgi:endonuclease/exonuclease/phosphatase family metal-dependent hydrolase
MQYRRLVATVAGFALALGLASGAVAAPKHKPEKVKPDKAIVDVATYNLYLGADLTPLFSAGNYFDLVASAGQVYAAMEATDFTERAGTIAKLIAKERPDVVGLQEVALWETSPGNILTPSGPFTTEYDFLDLLLDELAGRGVPYEEVATNTNFTGTLPIALAGTHPIYESSTWARFTDHDVILVRSGLPARHLSVDPASVEEHVFDAELVIPSSAGVPPFRVPRGWSSVDVTVKGFTFRFFNTHLEAFNDPDEEFGYYRNLQAVELAEVIEESPYPAVVVGDINSRPPCDGFNTEAYEILIGVGLVEVWPQVHRKDPCGGNTSGQAADLLNAESELNHRIDTIMFDPDALTAIRTEVIGDEQRDRSKPSGFWPSDHAGSVATLKTVRP